MICPNCSELLNPGDSSFTECLSCGFIFTDLDSPDPTNAEDYLNRILLSPLPLDPEESDNEDYQIPDHQGSSKEY